MEAEFAGSVGEGSVLDFVAEGTDIVAVGATGFDLAAEHSDLGATAELEAGFVEVLAVPVFRGVSGFGKILNSIRSEFISLFGGSCM